MQEPASESDQDMEKNKDVKRLDKPSMRQKVQTMVESGTCNVCSAPCSSCMHLKLAHMVSKDDEFTDENCHVTATSQYSINEGDAAPSFKNRACDNLQHAASEASNPLSVCSSHDSLSEIADSKANIRSSDFSDASLEFGIQKLSSEGIITDNQRSLLIKHEDCKNEEGHDDNISCVSGVNDASVSVGHYTENLEKTNLLHSSPLVSIFKLEGSAVDGTRSSPKVRKNFLSSDWNVDHFEKDSDFHHNGKQLEHPREKMNLVLSKEAASSIAPGQSFTIDASADALLISRSLAKGDNFKPSSAVCTKLESELGGESEVLMDGSLKVSQKVEQDEKSNVPVSLPEMQEPPSQSFAGAESEDSENSELDVKICDICGDAGREDLLAICCRCSDGAEHTYCMREMVPEVPEGYWLCEECKLYVESENRKQDVEVKMTSKVSVQSSGKRHAEPIEVSSASKRQAIEMSIGSPKPSSPGRMPKPSSPGRMPKASSPGRMPSLSRDNSFKSLDKGKVRHAYPASVVNHSGVDISEISHSSSSGSRLQAAKGTLLKSNSFSTLMSRPKVKPVDEVPQKHKSAKDLFSDAKEASGRMISKSKSFKSVNSGRSLATESKVKLLPSKFSLAPDFKRLKQVKDRSAHEKKISPKFDCRTSFDKKLTPLCETGIVSSATDKKDLKAAESDGKLGILSRSNSSIVRRGSEIVASSAQASCPNVLNNALVEQRLNQVSPKEESSSSAWTAERPSRSMRCHTCKEIGHAAEFCTVGGSLASSADVPIARSVRGDMNKDRRLKAAIEAAVLKKPGICRKRKEHDQSDGLPSSNVDTNCEIASQDKLSSLNKTSEVTHVGLADSGIHRSASYKQTDMNNLNQLNACSADAIIPLKVDSDSNAQSVGMSRYWSASISVHMKMLTIPEHGYIWQGTFEVCRAGKVPDSYSGIQAHLSTCASPKVLEVVKKFPQKITLDEVPRLRTWPRQFHDCGVREENIALYFFAKDIESFTKNYKGLVDSMIQNDLALKGSFDGVELFIFPSIQLPENSQRWNQLFYMWGVFKGRRSDCSYSSKKSSDKEDTNKAIMSSSGNQTPSETLDKEATACSGSYDIARGLNDALHKSHVSSSMEPDNTLLASNVNLQTYAGGLDSKSLPVVSRKSMLLHPEVRSSSPSLQGEGDVLSKRETKLEASTMEIGTADDPAGRDEAQISRGASRLVSTKSLHDGKKDASVRDLGELNVVAKIHNDKDEVKVRRESTKDNVSMESLDTCPRKLPHLDHSIVTLVTSDGASEIAQRINIEGTLIGGESASEKLRSCFRGSDEVSNARDGNSSNTNLCSRKCDLGSSSSVVAESCDKAPDEKIILEDLGMTERYFFPVDSHHAKGLHLGDYSLPMKEKASNDDNQILEVVPNLELALGAKGKSQNKAALPLLVGLVDKNNNQNNNQYKPANKVMDMEEEEEDGVSASLSLSLSFPFPDKEQNVKSVSKEKQFVPERRDVNTSLLLFGGFSDK